MTEHAPPSTLLEQLTQSHIGRVERCVPHERGAQAQVWRLVGTHGRAVLKCHRNAGGWQRETTAYRHCAALQGDALPRVLAALRSPIPALLLSELPGVSLGRTQPSAREFVEIHRQAGRIRARLDTIDWEDPLPLYRAYESRFEHWYERSRTRIPEDLRQRARASFSPAAFVGIRRVACHRDFTPMNWLIERRENHLHLRVVDLGQARSDIALVDLVKLREDTWHERPALANAFLDGWDRTLEPGDHVRLDLLGILHGLATATWAHRHGDAALLAHGLAILERRT